MVSASYSHACYQRPALRMPNGDDRVVLHSCCAPCSGEVIEAIHFSGIGLEVLFYNPNIHPREEYELRKGENITLCRDLGIAFYEGDYETDQWFSRVKGLEWEPERGERCTRCFDMRFERTALFAHERGVRVITSCLGISRWKNMEQINRCGARAASRYPGMVYWDFNWRKQGGAGRMLEIAKERRMYQQEYCGCVYSLRDTNLWRRKQGRNAIRIGEQYYGDAGVAELVGAHSRDGSAGAD